MPNQVVQALNLMSVFVDIGIRHTIKDLTSETPVPSWVFARGDTLKGTIYTVSPTGTANPYFNQFVVNSYQLAITDGWSTQLATATGWESWGGTTNPHMTFDLAISGGALDVVLHGLTSAYNAFLEIEINGIAASEGSVFPQTQYTIREAASIYPSGLNPAP